MTTMTIMTNQLLKIHTRSFFTIGKTKYQSTLKYIDKEKKATANNYEPIPVVIVRGEGVHVWDPEGKRYLDFCAAYATLNMGHCHPKLLKAFRDQAGILTHTSRAFYNNMLPEYAKYITQYFEYDKVLPMNTGVEAGETAVKLARRWGYMIKKVPPCKALVVFPEGNFWGRTLAAISTSTNPTCYENFGPFMPGFGLVPYNDVCALEEVCRKPDVVAYFMEPIQGEAGVIVPCQDYLKEVRRITKENNVLWIADEIQTGLGRTGRLLATDHECVRPDVLLLGKGLGGGFIPVSAVLAMKEVMEVFTVGSHGSTFGGNPLACRMAMESLAVLQEEDLICNSLILGDKFRKYLNCYLPSDVVLDVRGKGLMSAITVNSEKVLAWDFCIKLKEHGLLAKNCGDCTVRFTPPLMITEEEMFKGAEIIVRVAMEVKGCSWMKKD